MEAKSGTGNIESKEEGSSKNGPYWKYTINGKIFSFWEYDEGQKIKVGDNVKMEWEEKEGQGSHGPITYRNLKCIYKTNDSRSSTSDEDLAKEEKEVSRQMGGGVAPHGTSYSEGAKEGMFWNNAIALCISEKKSNVRDIQAWYHRLKKGFEDRNK